MPVWVPYLVLVLVLMVVVVLPRLERLLALQHQHFSTSTNTSTSTPPPAPTLKHSHQHQHAHQHQYQHQHQQCGHLPKSPMAHDFKPPGPSYLMLDTLPTILDGPKRPAPHPPTESCLGCYPGLPLRNRNKHRRIACNYSSPSRFPGLSHKMSFFYMVK